MSDRTADDRARYVVKLNLNGIEGLGVVIPWHILTCAHFWETVKIDWLSCLELIGTIPGCEESVYYVQMLDGLMDFMVLGNEPLNVGLDDDGWVDPVEPPIKPVRIVFPKGQTAVRIPVYFFAPDGKTTIAAHAKVYKHSHIIMLDQVDGNGGIGSPVFTADHRLVGIMQGRFSYGDSRLDEGVAVRIDKAANGWLVDELGGLDEWMVKGDFLKEPALE